MTYSPTARSVRCTTSLASTPRIIKAARRPARAPDPLESISISAGSISAGGGGATSRGFFAHFFLGGGAGRGAPRPPGGGELQKQNTNIFWEDGRGAGEKTPSL